MSSDPWTSVDGEYVQPTPPQESTELDRMNFILNQFHEVGNTVQGLAQNQQALFEAINSMATRFSSLPLPTSSPNPPPIKFKEPPVYKGKTEELEDFLSSIENGIKMQRAAFISDEERVNYMVSYFGEGTPRSWLTGVRKTAPHLLADFSAFMSAFKEHFGDHDAVATALRRIEKLEQTGSCISYAACFCELAAVLDLSQTTLMQYFRRGLKNPVRQGLVYSHDIKTFDDLEKAAFDIDNELYQFNLDQKRAEGKNRSHSNTNPSGTQHNSRNNNANHSRNTNTNSRSSHSSTPPASSTTPSTSSSSSGPVPMEIDGVRRGPLTTEERKRRKDNNLCMYCATSGHRAKNCPQLANRNNNNTSKPSVAAVTSEKVQSEAN